MEGFQKGHTATTIATEMATGSIIGGTSAATTAARSRYVGTI